MIDLNTLIPPNSALELFIGGSINDRRGITGQGLLANGDEHVFVLIPCNDSGGDEAGLRKLRPLHGEPKYRRARRAESNNNHSS